MSDPTKVNVPCAPDSPTTCGTQARTVQANVTSGVVEYGNSKPLAWVNSYDITTIPWGYIVIGTFSSANNASPDSTSSSPGALGYQGSQFPVGEPVLTASFAFRTDGQDAAYDTSSGARSQLFVASPVSYMALALVAYTDDSASPWYYPPVSGGGDPSEYWANYGYVAGCLASITGTICQGGIVDVPVPDIGLATNYLIIPVTAAFPTLSSLLSTTPGVNDYTYDTWNTGQTCSPATGDPFAAP